MNVDIVSDVVCPWCFVGKRRFERAVAARPELDVSVSWRAFQLNPDMPEDGMDRAAYLAAKFGSDQRAEAIYADIAEAGRGEDIAFAFDRISHTPNTIDAHRVIRLAGIHGVQDGVVEALFHGYFETGVNIGDTEQLAALAATGGLDAALTRVHLLSDDAVEEVRAEDLQARQLGINGVPCFIVDNRYAISGAQAPEVFDRIFDTALQAQASAETPASSERKSG
jgi:predicted DsbA family dithiol-disulfide isomerase